MAGPGGYNRSDRRRRCIIEHFADRLVTKCREKSTPVCVGLDPVFERLPAALRNKYADPSGRPATAEAAADALREFCVEVMRAVAPHVAVVKPQSACFERYLWPGVRAYHQVINEACRLGLIVIGDAKRGDIGASSEHYAAGCLGATQFTDLGSLPGPDALTVNSYLGVDGLEPFIKVAAAQGKGLFVLVRTSNPGGDAIQGLTLGDHRRVTEAVAQIVAQAGAAHVGTSGFSLIGAVVGATKPQDAARLRELMPQQVFLVPGFGAQGGKADDVRACFRPDGTGAIITASRSVIFAYDKDTSGSWQSAVERAVLKMEAAMAGILC